jgi:hypothetical protein
LNETNQMNQINQINKTNQISTVPQQLFHSLLKHWKSCQRDVYNKAKLSGRSRVRFLSLSGVYLA